MNEMMKLVIHDLVQNKYAALKRNLERKKDFYHSLSELTRAMEGAWIESISQYDISSDLELMLDAIEEGDSSNIPIYADCEIEDCMFLTAVASRISDSIYILPEYILRPENRDEAGIGGLYQKAEVLFKAGGSSKGHEDMPLEFIIRGGLDNAVRICTFLACLKNAFENKFYPMDVPKAATRLSMMPLSSMEMGLCLLGIKKSEMFPRGIYMISESYLDFIDDGWHYLLTHDKNGSRFEGGCPFGYAKVGQGKGGLITIMADAVEKSIAESLFPRLRSKWDAYSSSVLSYNEVSIIKNAGYLPLKN